LPNPQEIYLTPIYAISAGKDELSRIKIISAILIFTGVYLVSYKKKEPEKV
jgi:drug/metabolite transporter (DMT)-like permease